jgi:probable HAF family extracellular repeat protein
MKSRLLFATATVGLSTLQAMPVRVAAQEAEQQKAAHFQHYTVTDLGVLGTGTNSSGFGMNTAGWVGGSSNLVPGGPQHAFIWYGGGPLRDLGTLGGDACLNCNSAADGPNSFGEVPIISEIATADPNGEDFCAFGTHLQCRGAIWLFGRLKPLPNLPGGHNAVSIGINNLGQSVGWAETGISDPTCEQTTPFQVFRFQAVTWDLDGRIHQLSPLQGDTVAFAFGINDRGKAVGTSGTCSTVGLPPAFVNGQHAVLWERDGTPRYLGTLGDSSNTMFNAAGSINDRDEVDGTSQFTDSTIHSFKWTSATGMQDIGTLPGAFATIAPCCNSINNRSQIVGFSIDSNGSTAFLWQDNAIKDLNDLVPANSPLHLLAAQSINDAGEITGQGCVMPACTELHAFRARPAQR